MDSIKRFIADDQGADLVEYALLVGLIALALVGTLGDLKTSIKGLFDSIAGQLDTQAGS